LTRIELPFHFEETLRRMMELEKENIKRYTIKYKKIKHTEPSLVDALLYYKYKKDKQILFCMEETQKIIESENLEETKKIAENMLKLQI